MRIVDESELRANVDMPAAIEAMAGAFQALAEGRVRQPPPVGLDLPEVEGEVHLKGAHIEGASHFAFKIASGFYQNPSLGLPSGSGLILVFDARTGQTASLLRDNAYLTDLRTGAAGGLAARYLAPEGPLRVAVVGAGVQARMQLRALACEREIQDVAVWSRSGASAEACAARMTGELDGNVAAVAELEEAVRGANTILTVTPSREPLVMRDWVQPGTHITAVGSDGPGKQELDAALLGAADVVVGDRREQVVSLGEVQHAIGAGLLQGEDVVELGMIVTGARPGRSSADQVTVADLTGVGVQDAAIAALALEKAESLDLGRSL